MQCTPEQIEAKRKIALAKLKARKLQNSIQSTSSSDVNNGHNLNVSSSSNVNFKQNQSLVKFSRENNPNSTNQFKGYNSTNSPNYSIPKPNIQNVNNGNNFKILSSSPGNKLHNKNPYSKPGIATQQFFGKIITGTLCMISESRFEVNLSAYHVRAIEIFKSIPTKAYDAKIKLWNFDLKDYNLLLKELNTLRPELVVGKLPNFVLKELQAETSNSNELDLSKIDPELLGALMPFQRDGVYFGINRKGRVLIADDMGLGKTFQALAIAHFYKEDWPLLIVTTSSMRNTWEETIQKYLPTVPLMSIQYMVTGKDYIQDANVLIVSHDLMSRSIDKITDRRFGVVIIDESHVIKNFKAKVSIASKRLAKQAKRIILLSGTPALSRPNELYSQLALIDERFFGDFYEYSKRYCDGKTTNFGWDSSGKSNLAELELLLSKKFMIRRTKSDVLKVLPSKRREVFKLDISLSHLSDDERECLEELVHNFNIKKAQEKHMALLNLFTETSRIKIPSVCTYIIKILKENVKFLVFAHHQNMMEAICTVLNKNNKKYIRIDGSTNPDQRKFFIDKFQLDDSCICAVLSITATNAGITLTAAQLVLFAELHWNPSTLCQAESRAHRIGQQNEVIVRYLLASGTADDYIWPMLLDKQNVLNEVGLCKESFKDIVVVEQAVNTNNVKSQKCLTNWVTKNNSADADDTLNNFLQDEDDDIFANIDVE